MFNLKQLRQDKADLARQEASLKAEGRKLMAVAADKRTPEQVERLAAIEAELDQVAEQASLNAAEIARAERFAADELAGAPKVEVGKDNAEDRKATLGETMQAMAWAAFRATGRSDKAATVLPDGPAAHVIASIGGAGELQAAASGASSSVPESGGLLVRNEWSMALMNRVQEQAVLLPKCFRLPIGAGNDGIEAPYVDETSRANGSRWGGVQVYRAAEADTVTAKKPKLGKFELRLEDLMALFYATDRVLRDATLLESLAMQAFSSEFSFKMDDELVRGTGAGQSLGILNAGCTVSVAKETGQAADTVVFENILKMHSRLLGRLAAGAEWFVNQEVLPQLYKMYLAVGTSGVPVYLPANGASAAPFGTLMGKRVNVIEQASALGDVGDIIYANMSEMLAIEKPMTQAASMHVRFLYNEMTFRWVWPIIAKPTMQSAITPYKGASTYGPFVTLADRA